MHSKKPWGIDLTGRTMKYPPWLVDDKGAYLAPDSEQIEEIYGVSGEAIAETLLYFEKCAEIELKKHGGATSATGRLIDLLNSHVIDKRYLTDRETLLDKTRWVTNEYYFYFIMFTKKVMGRYDFHFGEGTDIQLGIHHKCYEYGLLEFVPFGGNDKDAINEIPYSFRTHYEKVGYDMSDVLKWADDLARYKTELSYTNDVCQIKNHWINNEFNTILYEFFKVVTNINSFYTMADASFESYSMKGFAFAPESMLLKVLNIMLNKSSNVYIVDSERKNNSATFYVRVSPDYNFRQVHHYKISTFTNSNQIMVAAFGQIIQRLFTLPVPPKIEHISDISSTTFNFTLSWEKRILTIPFLGIIIANLIAFGSIYVLGRFQLDVVYQILLVILTNALTIVIRWLKVEKNKRQIVEKHIVDVIKYNEERVDEIRQIAQQLVSEKNSLEEKVRDRTGELAEANQRLKELDQAKSRFFANVSHELRTPLTLILAPLEAFIDGEYGDSLTRDARIINSMFLNSKRLLRLINNLLDFAKVDAGRMTLSLKKIKIDETVSFWVESIRSGADTRGINVSFVNQAPGLTVTADIDMLEKAVFNLLSNSFKFTPDGGKIIVTLSGSGGNFIIKVADTGIGIPKEKQPYIFERFSQVDNTVTRKYEGTGIGLALTKEIVELHHGQITLESDQGRGSVFSLILPVSHPEEIHAPVEESSVREVKSFLLADMQARDEYHYRTSAHSSPEIKGKPRILLVEDNPEMRFFIRDLLERYYTVNEAENGIRALEALKEFQADLVITDLMMPEMDGYELLSLMKNNPDTHAIPVIVLTAKTETEMKLDGLSKGADDFLSKPFDSKELFARVKNLIYNRKLENELLQRQTAIDADFQQAAMVQSAVLTPERIYRNMEGIDVDVRYIPMNNSISGDYYNLSRLDNGIASVLLADASGHGIQAALTTMQIDLLNRETSIINLPSERFDAINRQLMENYQNRNFFTAVSVDIFHDRVCFSSAAHPVQYLICSSGESIISLKTPGTIIGLLENVEYVYREESVSPGDILLLFTDGLFEVFNESGAEFGEEVLMEFISRNAGKLKSMTSSEICGFLMEEIENFRGNAPVNDDICLIVIKIK